MHLLLRNLGNRSSVDDARSDAPEDETTVVEPDQGNGEISHGPVLRLRNAG